MATFKTKTQTLSKDGTNISIVPKDNFDAFNEEILGLGKIDVKSVQTDALSVMFDLEGFTTFCKQIDPHLAVPEYLNEFLKWIFEQVKKELTEKKHPEGYELWAKLPFLSKFLGDGILFLWDTSSMHEIEITNIVTAMHTICENYNNDFFPLISKSITSPPPKLRCGIARGTIYSVGNGNDFVGPCINMSARLQKLHSLSFCFARRGINPNKMEPEYRKLFIVKKVDIRGIGNEELVCILKDEFNKLEKIDKDKFSD